MSTAKEAKDCYISTLADLTFNSKPLINVLTMLAEENIAHAPVIVEAIESHLIKGLVDVKLPALYLIDCIIKNIGGIYKTLLCQNIVSIFCHVFQVVNEKTRGEMFKLRQTWNDELPKTKLCELDMKVKQLDPAWPILLPQLTNNIHLNPKFLHNSAIPKKSPPLNIPSQTSLIANRDLDTIEMQKNFIIKQKQLLELERMKLELELLQQQVKMQQQPQSAEVSTEQVADTVTVAPEPSKLSKTQNILLKPEVAKQLSNTTPTSIPKGKNSTASSILGHRLHADQTTTASTSSTPKIAPVNSALLAAATSRPIRDPRLLRHQNSTTGSTASTASTAAASNLSTTVNTNVHLESKTSSSSSSTFATTTAETISSNNKNFTSKVSVREHHRTTTEPRLVAGYSAVPRQSNIAAVAPNQSSNRAGKSQIQSKKSKQFSNSTDSSPSPTKSSSKSSRAGSKSSASSDGGSSKNSSASSLLDSPSKAKSGASKSDSKTTRPTAASSSKHKKKEATSTGGALLSSTRSDKKKGPPSASSSKQRFSGDKETGKSASSSPTKRDHGSGSPNMAFKEIKGSKSRNYMRRNRQPSGSPETVSMDVDLRPSAPPPEKQPRLQADITEEKGSTTDLATSGMDVDLRQLPALISKKRSSTEAPESTSVKKSKMEVFDELFGNEDTDLRQLPAVISSPKVHERPPTPPPPIISLKSKSDLDDSPEVKIISPKSSNLDLVREKLANATIRNKMNNSRFNLADQRKSKSKLYSSHEDVDLRTANADDSFNKIIISSADEQCIKTGNMTKEQETALLNKILAQIENQKLNEAKRTEENSGNISLQPISDEELEVDFSGSSDEDRSNYRPNIYSDKDERVPPPAPHINPGDPFANFPRNSMDNMRRGAMWRGVRPRRGIMPARGIRMMRPPGPPDSWIRPNGPWRPMVSGFAKLPHAFNSEVMEIDGGSIDVFDQNSNQSLPPLSLQETPEIVIVDCADQDNVKSIVIDNESRDIRYYDDTAVVFMNWSDPREISFQNGSRKVFFGDNDVAILAFNEPYKDVNINGAVHKVKLGGPSRELHIDERWYECFIGGPGIRIDLDGDFVLVKIEGPPPQVKIGQSKRTDLVAGKINLIVDAKTVVPVFLDGKLQKFDLQGQMHTLRFINQLQMALIDDTPFEISFGSLPKPVLLHDKKCYIRFSVLPRGIKPGHVNIQGMENIMLPVDQTEPVLPVFNKRIVQRGGANSPDRNSNSPLSFQNLFQQQNLSSNLETLSSLMASSLMPSQSVSNLASSSYQIENDDFLESSSQNPPEIPTCTGLPAVGASVLPPSVNINELFQKLVATGIVTTAQDNQPALVTAQSTIPVVPSIFRTANMSQKKELLPNIKPVTFGKPETLKIRQPALITTLYSGMQCSSCGMRFPPEHSMQYSQHLDWHFRQNRKGKKNIRKASSRRWYYSLSDWKNYEEIEDLEEREKSYFENQQQAQAEGAPDEAEEEIEIPSVPADPAVQDARCEVCQDRFDQFYNEEKEEWHLRNALRVDGKDYHPVCYEDYQSSLMDTTYEEVTKLEGIFIPGLEVQSDILGRESESSEPAEIVIDDDEPEQTDGDGREVDEEEFKSEEAFPAIDEEKEEDGEDDDVIINEVVPEKIDLVDDDRYEEQLPARETPDIMVKEEPVDDGFVDVEGGVIKAANMTDVRIKTEPIDPDDELQITGEQHLDESKMNVSDRPEVMAPSHTNEVLTFIDGNVEFDSGVGLPTGAISGKIKINITKPLPVIAPKESNNKELNSEVDKTAESIDPSQPLPPGEEPIQLNLKPALQGVKLKKLPPAKKGTELTGLCSIM